MHTSANSTGLITGQTTFSPVGPSNAQQHLFKVNEGVDAEFALSKASCLLADMHELVLDAAMGESLSSAKAWLMLHALESSKALIDALAHRLQFPHE